MNDTQSSFQNLRQEKIQEETDTQSKVMEAIIDADGGHIIWMTRGSGGNDFNVNPSPGWCPHL